MSTLPKATTATIIPCLRYRDAPAAIEWLCEAFGFQKHLVVSDENGAIAHAQLKFGNGMIMLGSTREGVDEGMIQPEQAGGETQAPYVVVNDADSHYAGAKRAGARITYELADQDYGGRLYSCLDPENHLWHFGTYDPWDESSPN